MSKLYRKTKNTEQNYNYPVLTRRKRKEYRYILSKNQLRIRVAIKIQYKGVADEDLPLPYGFIVGLLKQYVYNIEGKLPEEQKDCGEKVLLLAKSSKRGFYVAVLVSMKDYVMTVHDVQKIKSHEYQNRVEQLYTNVKHHYFETLDLDEYLEEVKGSRVKYFQNKRKKVIKKADLIYHHDTYQYFCKISNHAYTKRSSTKETRLTLPKKAVYDLLKYLLKSEDSYASLQQKLMYIKEEKQIALVFYNRDRTHLVSLLAAFNISIDGLMLITVITMYDNIPQDKSAQKFLFPKVERITLYDYDLGTFMDQYDEKQKEREETKELKRKEQLARYREESNITKVSSLDEYYENNLHIRKADGSLKSTRKIRKLKVEKMHHVEVNKPKQKVQNMQLSSEYNKKYQWRFLSWILNKVYSLLSWIKVRLSFR